jgi:predicted outer membrane repeat protein
MMQFWYLFTCIALSHYLLSPTYGTIWYVSPAGDDLSPDGTNATTPLASVQTAIHYCSSIGDTIQLFPGVYIVQGNNSHIQFYGKQITIESMNDIPSTTIFDCLGKNTGPVFQYRNGEGPTSVLRGFTIQNCICQAGCAVFISQDASPSFENMIFQNNVASVQGGAIYGSLMQYLSLLDCRLVNNSAQTGGAIYLTFATTVVIQSSNILQNTASQVAGVFIGGSNSISIDTCIFDSNIASSNYGALRVESSTLFTMINTNLTRNTSPLDGSGGISLFQTTFQIKSSRFEHNIGYNGSSIYAYQCVVGLNIIESSSFANNNATNSGGAMYLLQSPVYVNSSIFTNNKALMSLGGAVYTNSLFKSDYSIWMNQFAAKSGGSLFMDGISTSMLILFYNQFYNCTAYDTGGSIAIIGSSSFILNDTIFSFNIGINNGGAIYSSGKASIIIYRTIFNSNQSPGQPYSALAATLTGLGGGIAHSSTGKIIIVQSEFYNNVAGTSGGAICILSGSYNLQSLIIEYNFALRGTGGGISLGAFMAAILFYQVNSTLSLVKDRICTNNCQWNGNIGAGNQNDTGSLPMSIQWSSAELGYPKDGAKSGQVYVVTVRLVDGFNQTFRDGGYNKTVLIISSAYLAGGGGLLLPNVTNGEGQFSLQLIGVPGNNYTIFLYATGLGTLLPTTYTFHFASCTDREKQLSYVEQNSGAGLGALINPLLNVSTPTLEICQPIMDYSMSTSAKNGFSFSGISFEFLFLGLLIFAWWFRNERSIIQSSYVFCQLINVGCILVLIPYLWMTTNLTPAQCTGRVWCFHLGFTLCYGSMFWKTYRLHSIFYQTSLKAIIILDRDLLWKLGIFVLIDILLLLWWTIIQYPYYIHETLICQSDGAYLFYPLMTTLKGCLLLATCILAYRVRDLPDRYNESKPNALAIYNCTMLGLIWIVLSNGGVILPSNINVLEASLIILGTFITMSLIYFPKIYAIVSGKEWTLKSLLHASQSISPIENQSKYKANHVGSDKSSNSKSTTEQPILSERIQRLNQNLHTFTREVSRLENDLKAAQARLIDCRCEIHNVAEEIDIVYRKTGKRVHIPELNAEMTVTSPINPELARVSVARNDTLRIQHSPVTQRPPSLTAPSSFPPPSPTPLIQQPLSLSPRTQQASPTQVNFPPSSPGQIQQPLTQPLSSPTPPSVTSSLPLHSNHPNHQLNTLVPIGSQTLRASNKPVSIPSTPRAIT